MNENKKTLYDTWGKRNPRFEIQFENEIIRRYSDYGKGTSEATSSKAKQFGAGYEVYIYAFFIGLYANKRRKLEGATKVLGHPLENWGNIEGRKLRQPYSKLRNYIFVALVAKTEIDFIKLEEEELSVNEAVSMLIDTMEEYANYGFYAMREKIQNTPDYFYLKTGFLDFILELTKNNKNINEEIEELI